MAKIIVKKSNNKVISCIENTETITIDSTSCVVTSSDGNIELTGVNSTTHDIYEAVSEPTKFWGQCFTYIDGNWAIDSNYVNSLNEFRTLNGHETLEVEL